jgi:hypothetical protein
MLNIDMSLDVFKNTSNSYYEFAVLRLFRSGRVVQEVKFEKGSKLPKVLQAVRSFSESLLFDELEIEVEKGAFPFISCTTLVGNHGTSFVMKCSRDSSLKFISTYIRGSEGYVWALVALIKIAVGSEGRVLNRLELDVPEAVVKESFVPKVENSPIRMAKKHHSARNSANVEGRNTEMINSNHLTTRLPTESSTLSNLAPI